MVLPLVLSCLLAIAQTGFADGPQGPNLVPNPGFEELETNGGPAGWNAPGHVYSAVSDPVHSGSQALQFVNGNPNDYVLCTRELPLKPGLAYEVSLWVKTEDIKGEDTGATVCLEWYAGSKYLGGCYPSGVKGTSDWKLVRGVARVAEGATHCQVDCYVRKGMTGKAWFDDVEVRRWCGPPMSSLLLKPNYRGLLAPGAQAQLQVNLTLDDYDLKPADVTLRTELVRCQDGKAAGARRWTLAAATTVLTIPTAGLAPGRYDLRVVLERYGGFEDMAVRTWALEVAAPGSLEARKSYIDGHNRLIRDGKPFFPLGMYWGGISEDELKVYADSPFNCLMPYGSPDRERMDLAQSCGLKVIYSVKDTYFGSTWAPAEIRSVEDEQPFLEGRVKEFRDHPALLAWYLNDELGQEFMPRLEAHQQWVSELDPNHPTWVVLYQVGEVAAYARSFDVIGTDPYPIPRTAPRMAGEWTRATVGSLGDSRPVWMVPQVFNWGCYGGDAADKTGLRPPTLAEMRSMAWQCIVEGAKGLIFYSWFDIRKDTVVPFDRQWPLVKQMAGEIKDLAPVILSLEPTPKFRAPVRPWLHWTTRRVEGDVYLIAVNNEDKSHQVTFNLGSEPKGLVTRATDELRMGNLLKCEFSPLEVKVYRMGF